MGTGETTPGRQLVRASSWLGFCVVGPLFLGNFQVITIIVQTESPKLGYRNSFKAHVYTMELLVAFGERL